jgi:DNA-binding SARP family transcriptional activator
MVTIRLLGGASIQELGDGAAGRPVQRSRMALLAGLALTRTRSATRDRLMGLLWPEADTDRARHLLREQVYRLRATLGDAAVISSGDELRLSAAHVVCDVWQFEDAIARQDWAAADRLYAGPLLDTVFLSDTPEFENYVRAECARLAVLHGHALEALAQAHGQQGDWANAVTCWQRRSADDPYDGRVAVCLMEALEAAGNRAAALRVAAAHAALLDVELGAVPDTAVLAVAERLRERPLPPRVVGTHDTAVTGDSGAGSAPAPSAATANRVRVPDPGGAVPRSTRRPLMRRAVYGAGVLVITLASAATLMVLRENPSIALDPDRIVIVPFRVSGADPVLGQLQDGLVELLALQFTGEFGPPAVDPGEALRAWRGVNPRLDPATPSLAMRVARRVGAGQVVIGSVVGSADRFTISASVLDGTSGAVLLAPSQWTGPIDSLSAALASLSAHLLAQRAGGWTIAASALGSPSTAVLRAYLRAMVAYRAGDMLRAGTELYYAVELDTAFVPAAYRFALVHAIMAPWTPFGTVTDARLAALYGQLWKQRHRLPPEQRLLLEAVVDSSDVLFRMVALPRLERVVTLIPGSVEAWDILGDDYYHAGALTGREDWAARARDAFERALSLDAMLAVNAKQHLADLAFMQRDARAHAAAVVTANGPRSPAYYRYQSALIAANGDSIRPARSEYARAWARGEADGIAWAFRGLSLQRSELDSLLGQFAAAARTAEQRDQVAVWAVVAAMMGGQFATADSLQQVYGHSQIDRLQTLLHSGVRDSVAAERVAEAEWRARAESGPRQTGFPWLCNAALARLRHGDSTGVGAILAVLPRLDDAQSAAAGVATLGRGHAARAALCSEVLLGVLHARTERDMRRLRRADSAMRLTPLSYRDGWNLELAHAFAELGDYAAAASASRRRFIDLLPAQHLVVSLRHEGRWAALAGDTAAAVAAYRHYLLWRDAPEAALIPERDSIRSELKAMERAAVRSQRPARPRFR